MVQNYTISSESQRKSRNIRLSQYVKDRTGEAQSVLFLIDAHLGHGAKERILIGVGCAEVGEVGARLVALVLAVVAAVGIEGTRGERTADAERRHVADGEHAPVADARGRRHIAQDDVGEGIGGRAAESRLGRGEQQQVSRLVARCRGTEHGAALVGGADGGEPGAVASTTVIIVTIIVVIVVWVVVIISLICTAAILVEIKVMVRSPSQVAPVMVPVRLTPTASVYVPSMLIL